MQTTTPNPIGLYLFVIICEWAILAIVLLGVRSSGVPLTSVLGPRWNSARHVDKTAPDMRYLIPHGAAQLALWICFAVTAGVCEEAIFRGYLQRQFSVVTRLVPAGIGISAVLFGACHIYQGPRLATMIALYGALYGILAYWRKSVRPGMIAHAWQDAMGGILSSVLKH